MDYLGIIREGYLDDRDILIFNHGDGDACLKGRRGADAGFH